MSFSDGLISPSIIPSSSTYVNVNGRCSSFPSSSTCVCFRSSGGVGPSVNFLAPLAVVSRGTGAGPLHFQPHSFALPYRSSSLGLQEMGSEEKEGQGRGKAALFSLPFWPYTVSKNLGDHSQRTKTLRFIKPSVTGEEPGDRNKILALLFISRIEPKCFL